MKVKATVVAKSHKEIFESILISEGNILPKI